MAISQSSDTAIVSKQPVSKGEARENKPRDRKEEKPKNKLQQPAGHQPGQILAMRDTTG